MTQEALKYLQTGAIVPVDMETTRILVNALKEALAQTKREPQIAFNAEVIGYVAPQRTWVGLTVKEVNDLYDSDYSAFHQRIEAKLKQKNG